VSATDLAQRKNKTGPFSPAYSLQVAGGPFRSRLYDGTVTYSTDGNSDMSISADADLTDLVGAKVVLEVGYGDDLWPYFGGYLEEPEDDHWGGPSNALAYGPYKELAEASIGEDVSYEGQTLGQAIVDLHSRAGQAAAGTKYEILGSPNYLLTGEQAHLTLATSFADGINTFLEAAGWVSVDRPGFIRRYRPKPRPRPSGEAVAAYTETHYPPGGFRAVRGKPYGAVGAFARNEDGTFAWPPVKIRVQPNSKFKTSALKTYWLEDWAGSEDEAWTEVGKLASLLSDGVYTWSLSGISANPDLHLYDTIRVKTTELRDDGGRFKERYEVTYACAIDTEISLDVSREGYPMNLAGNTAIKVAEKRLKRPLLVARGDSSVVTP
jgi:hypothetical protein